MKPEISSSTLAALEKIVGSECLILLDSPEKQEEWSHYGKDRTTTYSGDPSLILFPHSTEEVAEIVKICNREKLPIVPSGGRTGYSGAAVAANGEILLSLEKMDRLLDLDTDSGIAHVQAGMITDKLNDFLKAEKLFFPVQFAATGSTQIGGNISTNAGGVHVIRYGNIKDWVLALTVVDGQGIIHHWGGYYLKDSSGYRIKELFIGAEGTLGIVTEASLRLVPAIEDQTVLLLATRSVRNLIRIYRALRSLPLELLAVEFFTDFCLQKVLEHQPTMGRPFPEDSPYFILAEFNKPKAFKKQTEEILFQFLEEMLNGKLVTDGTLAQNSKQEAALWSYRENISESLSVNYTVHKNDISVPLAQLEHFLKDLEILYQGSLNKFQPAIFGHIGDGNLHINSLMPTGITESDFAVETANIDKEIFTLVNEYHGSISAEHGIGLLKKKALIRYKNKDELDIMRAIKKLFDPSGILNPGKIFD